MATQAAKPISWNQFGTIFHDENVTIQDAFDEAGLNYNVEQAPLLRVPQAVVDAILAGEPVDFAPTAQNIITSHKATVRSDANRTLGVVGRDYGIVQNTKAFEFIDFIGECSGTQPRIVSAGALGYGERIYVTAQLGEDSYLNPDDAVKNYVVFTTSHDGSGAVMCMMTPVRVVCQNTLNMAIRNCPNKVVFKHTKNVNVRMDWEVEENRRRAAEVFTRSVQFSKEFLERMLALREQVVDRNYVRDFAAKMFLNDTQFGLLQRADYDMERVDEISTRTRNQINALTTSIESGVGQEFNRGTKLWLLNGITTYLHNDRNWKSGEDEFRSLNEGDGLKKVQRAYDMLIAA